ncbi:MAG: isoprenylcysteine carboxylmethyltransferase family protein [Deltaproteobacteria bacterium]|jgi:protein-S-isoprenylcysteine O-methyltransferase Ste14|nr:isoprenylcysteine carboxylmethyltransferase family protein [Deltaproteobacteria bacterium]
MDNPRGQRFLLWVTSFAYVLIALEVLFMITPFALYFYGVYGPILEWLSIHKATAWTTEFFLPHMVFVDDSLLNGIAYMQALFVIGMVLFLLAAVPLYFGRLTGRGVVSFGPYAKLRHPQYLFLALSGFGLLLYWPRFIVLIFFVTMLFVYYLLARNEEWRMKREQPGRYEQYMQHTSMFLPGEPGRFLFKMLFGWVGPRWLGLLVCYFVVMAAALSTAWGLRAYTLERIPQIRVAKTQVVSVYPRPDDELKELFSIAQQSAKVQAFLADNPKRLVYIMPGDFFLTGLILQEGPRYSEHVLKRYPHLREISKNRHSGGVVKFFRLGYKFFKTIGTTRRVYDYERLVFVEILGPDGTNDHVHKPMEMGVRRLPGLVVDIDAETKELLSVETVSGNNAWGRLPMPNI